VQVSKEAKFCADLKNVQKSRVWPKGKDFLLKNLIFRDFENFAKNCFSEEKSWGTFLKSAQNSTSFDTLHAQFRRNIFFNSYKGRCCFFGSCSNKIETDQYFKKRFFIN
jgi:hypothetical protein